MYTDIYMNMMINVLSQNECFLGFRKMCNLTKHITFNLISASKMYTVDIK